MDPTTLTIIGISAIAALNGWEAFACRNRLSARRRNCFITNERGHRVRYFKASQEARAKAEGGV